MSTGVDAKTCKLIVLDQNIQSTTKFKQIIGRGTRIDDRYNKLWFTMLDFKKATELFDDELDSTNNTDDNQTALLIQQVTIKQTS